MAPMRSDENLRSGPNNIPMNLQLVRELVEWTQVR
jgi:hypothetical protein